MVLQKYLVEREGQRFQSLFPNLRLQLTFPDGDGVPAHRSQFMLHSCVPLLITPYLCHPKFTIRFRYLAALRTLNYWHCHPVSVPEASIYKDAGSVLPHHNIWLPRQPWMIQPITETMPPQPFTHHHLRLCVFAMDSSHVGGTLLFGEPVHLYLFKNSISSSIEQHTTEKSLYISSGASCIC
jgi:hypothetical protein